MKEKEVHKAILIQLKLLQLIMKLKNQIFKIILHHFKSNKRTKLTQGLL